MIYLIKMFILWLTIWQQLKLANCETLPSVSAQTQNAIRSQRDLMSNVTVDQIPLVGVNLGSVIFSNNSQNDTEALLALHSLMRHGVQSFVLDLEQRDNSWAVRDTNLSFSTFLLSFQAYINVTDDNLSANILTLHLQVSSNGENRNNSTDGSIISTNPSQPSSNITYILEQGLGRQRIYTPDDLRDDQQIGATFDTFGQSDSGWPTLDSFLYSKKKRILITELTGRLNYSEEPYIFNSSILHYDRGNKTLESPRTISQLVNLSSISWRFLESTFTPVDIRRYISLGFSPIISNSFSIENITSISELLEPSVIWSWDRNQPVTTYTDTAENSSALVAYNCAVLKYSSSNHSASWQVDNCYERYQGLCRYTDKAFEWQVTEARDTYFEFDDHTGSRCPDDYRFALPRTPLEQESLIIHLANSTYQTTDIWIDLNSIAVSNCWVSGGPYATCPYQRVVPRRNFFSMLTSVTVSCFVVLVMVSYLNFLRVPIHNNRKNWRKIVNEISKSELEGVPS